eukprot:gene367-56_t
MNGTNSSAGEPSASGGAVSSSSGFVETGTQEITAFVESNWEGPCGIIYGGAKDCSVINGVRRVGVYRDACQCDSGDGDLWPTNPGACFELKSGTDELSLCDDCSSTRVCRPVAKTQLLVNGACKAINGADSYTFEPSCKTMRRGNACPLGSWRPAHDADCRLGARCPPNVLPATLHTSCCEGVSQSAIPGNVGFCRRGTGTCEILGTKGDGWTGCHCATHEMPDRVCTVECVPPCKPPAAGIPSLPEGWATAALPVGVTTWSEAGARWREGPRTGGSASDGANGPSSAGSAKKAEETTAIAAFFERGSTGTARATGLEWSLAVAVNFLLILCCCYALRRVHHESKYVKLRKTLEQAESDAAASRREFERRAAAEAERARKEAQRKAELAARAMYEDDSEENDDDDDVEGGSDRVGAAASPVTSDSDARGAERWGAERGAERGPGSRLLRLDSDAIPSTSPGARSTSHAPKPPQSPTRRREPAPPSPRGLDNAGPVRNPPSFQAFRSNKSSRALPAGAAATPAAARGTSSGQGYAVKVGATG